MHHLKYSPLSIFITKHSMINSIRLLSTQASNNLTHYQILDIPATASIKEIKLQFKKLLKKYHPDLNQHLSDDERDAIKEKYMQIISSYEVLKDLKRKKAYDQSINLNHKREWNNKYYGEAKYHSKTNKSYNYTSLGLNTKRHKVRFHNGYTPDNTNANAKFTGEHVNYGDRYDVPHFDYEKHLNRNLKFEQRLIDKYLDQSTQTKILNQITRSNHDDILQELKTKHLLRHVNMIRNTNTSYSGSTSSPKYGESTTFNGSSASTAFHQNIYQKPRSTDEDSSMFKAFAILGGAGSSLYLLYQVVF